VHDAVEVAVLVIFPHPGNGTKTTPASEKGERTSRCAGVISCVDQGAIERDTSGTSVVHQQIRLPYLNGGGIVCQSNDYALLYRENSVKAVV
jgi:hypothetical protein